MASHGYYENEAKDVEVWVFKSLQVLKDIRDTQDQFLTIRDVFNELSVPDKLQRRVWDTLFQKKYVDIGKQSAKDFHTTIRINSKGQALVEKVETEHYELNEKIYSKMIQMPLEKTKELIFKLHKEGDGSLSWNKATFEPETPDNAQVAKRHLISDRYIENLNNRTTAICSAFFSCNSYAEAVAIKNAKNPVVETPSGKTENYTFHEKVENFNKDSFNNNKGNINQESDLRLKSETADANSKKPIINSKIDVGLILKIIAGVITIVLAVLKGCGTI